MNQAARRVVAAVLVVAFACASAPAATSDLPSPWPSKTWVPDTATSVLRVADTIYVGGTTRLTPRSGAGAVFDRRTGARIETSAELPIAVTAAVGDARGGFYAAIAEEWNDATRYPSDVRRSRLVHLLSDGSRRNGFGVSVSGAVSALSLRDGRLYVAGGFRSVAGRSRPNAAAIEAASGRVLPWNPRPNGPVGALAVGRGLVFLGGEFSRVGRHRRVGLASVEAGTGKVRTWNARIRMVSPESAHFGTEAFVGALLVSGTTLYVGGYFDRVRAVRRRCTAALDVRTGALRPWKPPLADPSQGVPVVTALTAGEGRVFLGGLDLGGLDSGTGLIAVDLVRGKRRWRGPPGLDVDALLFDGGSLRVGAGRYRRGRTEPLLWALDPRTGRRTSWTPNPDGRVLALARSAERVFAGGTFAGLSGVSRAGVSALDARTGEPTAWNPAPDGRVTAMARAGETIYFAGDFKTFGGKPHGRVAAVDEARGDVLDWDGGLPAGEDAVPVALAVASGRVFAGGANGVVAIDVDSRVSTRWPVSARASVESLATLGGVLYVAGNFTSIGGVQRAGLAAIDAGTGMVLPWNPDLAGRWTAIAVAGDAVYAGRSGKQFTREPGAGEIVALPVAGGAPRWRVRVTMPRLPLDADDDADGNIWPTVDAIAVDGSTLYAGGRFSRAGSGERTHLAALDAATGRVLTWHPALTPLQAFDTGVGSIAAQEGTVLVAGGFENAGDFAQRFFAKFEAPHPG